MKAIELIQNNVPPVRINESIEKALNWMDEFKLNHIPFRLKVNLYIPSYLQQVYDYNNLTDSISNINFIGNQHFVLENTHFIQIVSFLSKFKLSIIPVCDNQKNYKGSISGKKLLDIFSAQSGFASNGSILFLLVNNIDYQLSQISQIVESNDAKILSLYSESLESNKQIRLTLKLSECKLGALIQTFSRYEYVVEEIFSDSEVNNLSQQRYDHLMKYLNI